MLVARFPFQKRHSEIFGDVYRPMAKVNLWSYKIMDWVEAVMLVDSGADYTLLPHFYANILGIDLKNQCASFRTMGVGGTESVSLLREHPVQLGAWEARVSIGFLSRDNVPPLLGRQDFLEKLRVVFDRHTTYFYSRMKTRENDTVFIS